MKFYSIFWRESGFFCSVLFFEIHPVVNCSCISAFFHCCLVSHDTNIQLFLVTIYSLISFLAIMNNTAMNLLGEYMHTVFESIHKRRIVGS